MANDQWLINGWSMVKSMSIYIYIYIKSQAPVFQLADIALRERSYTRNFVDPFCGVAVKEGRVYLEQQARTQLPSNLFVKVSSACFPACGHCTAWEVIHTKLRRSQFQRSVKKSTQHFHPSIPVDLFSPQNKPYLRWNTCSPFVLGTLKCLQEKFAQTENFASGSFRQSR